MNLAITDKNLSSPPMKIVDQTRSLVTPVQTMNLPTPTLEQMDNLHQWLESRPDVKLLDLEAHTTHHFCRGQYARELRIPAGYTVVGKMHATDNFFQIVSGRVAVTTAKGLRIVEGPLLTVTRPGDKRIAHALTDTIMFNFHTRADDVEDVKALETRYVIPREHEGMFLAQARQAQLELLP